jgi:hypothetical protein
MNDNLYGRVSDALTNIFIDLLDRCVDACTEMRDSLIAHDDTFTQDNPDERLYIPTPKALAQFPVGMPVGAGLVPAPQKEAK